MAWGPERAGELASLLAEAMPDEHLSVDELLGVLWDDPGTVLAPEAGDAVVATVVRRHGELAVGHVRLLAVAPGAQRRGVGRQLLDAAEAGFRDEGAAVAVLGAEAPIYLWPGVDVTAVPALCLFEAAGYRTTGTEVNLVLPSSFRAPTPEGVLIRRAIGDADVAAVRDLVGQAWPSWSVELDRAIDAATAFVAVDAATEDPVGFCCHSVLRTGWLGPMGTRPVRQGAGVGAALVSAVCADLMVARRDRVEIAWVGPVRFYAKLGATHGRSFRTMSRSLD